MRAIDVLIFVILALFCYVLLWALIDRICKCCEKCAYYRAFGEYVKHGPILPLPREKSEEENK